MAAYSATSVIDKLKQAQVKPLLYQCNLIEEIVSTASTKDLRDTLPHILHQIFDFELESGAGWQLDKVFQGAHPELFNRLRKLLGPEGALMKLVGSLHADPHATYQFPFKALPGPARQMLEEGVVPAFYSNKVQALGSSVAIMVNAFELLMFHLAHALVSPSWQQRGQAWGELYDFLYPRLMDEYLTYFLPCDKAQLPPAPFTTNIVRPSIGNISPSRQCTLAPGGSPSPGSRSLFKNSFLQGVREAQKQHQQSMPVFDQAEHEIYRSETFLQVITEFWLNQNSFSGNEAVAWAGGIQEHFMPSMNQVKMARLLVKYLHYFTNSAAPLITSPFQSTLQSPLDTFKRSVVPHILQKKLYTFLRHAFDRWPLDSCFRMVLETWLSYIQPWRYTDFSRRLSPDNPTDGGEGKQVDIKWGDFVVDNLLFYTMLTCELVPRIHRMDLTSPYSAYMVYRVARILNLPNLSNIIFRAEQEVCGPPDHGGSFLSGPPPTPLMDLEGPGFVYIPYFSDTMKFNIMRIVEQMTEALDSVRRQQAQAETNRKAHQSQGFFATMFGGSGPPEKDLTPSPEQKRLPGHLEASIHNLCTVFSLPRPSSVSLAPSNTSILNESMYLADDKGGAPECVQTEMGLKLTDLGRRQLINRERQFDKFDMGDPDLEPVRSYESTTLVRLLFHLCVFINAFYVAELTSLYHSSEFKGHFARVFLTPPSSTQVNRILSPRTIRAAKVVHSDQPRVSLRPLASYHLLAQLGIAFIVQSLILGLSLFGFVMALAAGTFTYGVGRAIVSYFTRTAPMTSVQETSLTHGQGEMMSPLSSEMAQWAKGQGAG